MAWTEQTLAISASKRLKTDGESLLTLQSFIPNALNNLARKVASDDYQRRYLMTAPLSTSVNVTTSGYDYYADLSTLIASPQIMLDVLQYGTVFWQPATQTWVPADVSGNRISITNHGYQTGMPVLLSTSNALPAPLVLNTVYYVIRVSANTVSFASTQANAVAGTEVTLTDTGTAMSTATPQTRYPSQWYSSPNQAGLTSALPYPYAYIWLENTLLMTNKTNGAFKLNVPFVPTLDNLPTALESDLVDALVQIAITQGFEPITEAQK